MRAGSPRSHEVFHAEVEEFPSFSGMKRRSPPRPHGLPRRIARVMTGEGAKQEGGTRRHGEACPGAAGSSGTKLISRLREMYLGAARRVRTKERPVKLGRQPPHPAFGHLLSRGEKGKKGKRSGRPGNEKRPLFMRRFAPEGTTPSPGLWPPPPAGRGR